MNNISDEVQIICRIIWEYYFVINKNKISKAMISDDYEIVNKSIRELGISRIEFENDIISIWLNRPGLFVGIKGWNIDAISKFIFNGLKREIKIKIIEDRLPDFLYQYPIYEDF
jgi:ribosomal protein S3